MNLLRLPVWRAVAVAAMVTAGVCFSAEYRAFNPNPATPKNFYGLADHELQTDISSTPNYSYMRWGVLMSNAEDGRIEQVSSTAGSTPTVITPAWKFEFSRLTSSIDELFMLRPKPEDPSDYEVIPIPHSRVWESDHLLIPKSEPTVNAATLLMRKYHFEIASSATAQPPTPASPLIDEMTGGALSEATRKVIVLIHGWNPDSDDNSYEGSGDDADIEFSRLAEGLREILLRTGWSLVLYRWERDSDTGPLFGADLDNLGRKNGIEAAEAGHLHGIHLGEVLANRHPRLERAHFVAHSAGTWVARAAASALARNHSADIQVTLLDPFIPAEAGVSSDLSISRLEPLVFAVSSTLVWKAENFFCNDLAFGTNSRLFGGTLGRDYKVGIDEPADTEPLDFYFGARKYLSYVGYYDGRGHSGPIAFYSDSVSKAGLTSELLLHPDKISNFDLNVVGWRQSLFMREPIFLEQTRLNASTAAVGGQAIFTAWATTRAADNNIQRYEWLRGEELVGVSDRFAQSVDGATATLTISNLTLADEGTYRVRAISKDGLEELSQPVALKLGQPAPDLTITELAPASLTTAPLGQRQWLTIRGTGFTPQTTLAFNDGFTDYPSNPQYLQYISGTEIRYEIAVGPVPGTWTVHAEEGSLELSAPRTFSVVSPGAELVGLTISGPTSVNENSSALFVATANYSDGSKQVVRANWTGTGSGASLSSDGLLSAGAIPADTRHVVSASFTSGARTVSGSLEITIVNAVGVGTATGELVRNGDFSSGTEDWSLSGAFQADARFAGYRTATGYAYLAQTNGEAGDSLFGQLSQTLTIPPNCASVLLSYWYRISTQESAGAGRDFMFVRVLDSSGTRVLRIVDSRSDANTATAYSQRSFDLTEFSGKTIVLNFSATTNASAPTVFRVDDVSVIATRPTQVPAVGAGSIQVTGSGEVIQNGSTVTSVTGNNTDLGTIWMGEETSRRSYRIYNRGSATLGLTGTPPVRLEGSSSFVVAQQPVDAVAPDAYTYFAINFDPQATGEHRATVIVENTDPASPEFRFDISGTGRFRDLAAPTVVIENPTTEGSYTAGEGSVTLMGTAADNVGVVSVSWSNDRGGGGAASGNTFWNTGAIALRSGRNVITVTAGDAAGFVSTDSLAVDYTPTIPEIETSAARVRQLGVAGHAADSTSLSVRNSGSGVLTYSVAASSSTNWLHVTPDSGTSSGEMDQLIVSFDTSGLTAGTYEGQITVSSANSTNQSVAVPVTLVLEAVDPNQPYVARRITSLPNPVQTWAPATDGGMLISGFFSGSLEIDGKILTSAGGTDVFVAKLRHNGSVEWAARYGGTANDEPKDCCQNPAGGWVLSGSFEGDTTWGTQTLTAVRKRDAFIARLDDDGAVAWVHRLGGNDPDYGEKVAVDKAGNCFLVGMFMGTATMSGTGSTLTASGTQMDIFAAKYSHAGVLQWVQKGGGINYDSVASASTDGTGNLYIGGGMTPPATFGPFTLTGPQQATGDGFVTKLSAGGEYQWAKRIGETGGEYASDSVNFVTVTPSGDCYFGGTYQGPLSIDGAALERSNAWAGFIAHVPANTNSIGWLRSIRPTGFMSAHADRGAVLPDGSLFVIGRFSNGQLSLGSRTVVENSGNLTPDIFAARYSPEGTPQWVVSLGAPGTEDYPHALRPISTGYPALLMGTSGSSVTLPGLGSISNPSGQKMLVEFGPDLPNNAPTLVAPADQVITEDQSSEPLTFVVDDIDSARSTLTVTATSSNTAVIADAGIELGGTDATRTIRLTPVSNASGSAVITLTVSDSRAESSAQFHVNVEPQNDAPNQPNNSIPAADATIDTLAPALHASPFTDIENDAHASSQWQILDANETQLVWDSGEISPGADSQLIPRGELHGGVTYRWRVRYRDINGTWGNFSFPTAFTTPPKTSQSISFSPAIDLPFSFNGASLAATASSGLAVQLRVVSGPGRVVAGRLIADGTGTIVVEAVQIGDFAFAAAQTLQRSIQIVPSFDSWRAARLSAGEIDDPARGTATADPDQDGMPNLAEYALGSNPLQPERTPQELSRNAAEWSFTYTRPVDRGDITYVVEISTDLIVWTSEGVSQERQSTDGPSETWRAKYSGAATQCFFRLRVTRP